MAIGFGSFPLIREPWHAVAASAVAGVGNAAFWPSQSALLAGLTPHPRRHGAYALQRVTRNLGIGLGGLVGGLIATTSNPTSFTVLFAVDAVSFLLFVAVLPLVPEPVLPPREPGTAPGGYLDVLRDRVFLGVAGVNVLFVAAGYAVFELLPVFAKNEAGVQREGDRPHLLPQHARGRARAAPDGEAARRPAAHEGAGGDDRALGGRVADRAGGRALARSGSGGGRLCPLRARVRARGVLPGPGAGCARGRPRPAATARPLHGRLGQLVGSRLPARPRLGGVILATAPLALWPLAALACLLAGAAALGLERRIPRELRLTPA